LTELSTGEARETSGATTGGLLRYVRARAGDDAVARVLERSGLPFTAAQLDDQSLWWSYATRIRLFEAATEVLGDPATMYKVGSAALQTGLPTRWSSFCAPWARPGRCSASCRARS